MVPQEQLAVHARYVDAFMGARLGPRGAPLVNLTKSEQLMYWYPGIWRWAALRMFSVTGGQLSLAYKPQNENVREMQETFAWHHLTRAMDSGGVPIFTMVTRKLAEVRATRGAVR